MLSGVTQPWPGDGRDAVRSGTVTAVVCAAFDGPGDEAVLAVRDRVIRAGVALRRRPPHRPHLTLAAARLPPARLPQLLETVDDVAQRCPPVPLTLGHVGRFGRAGALWLGPDEPAEQLRALQRAVDGALTDAGWDRAFAGRTEPGTWVPHCSLATRLHPSRLREVQATISAGYRPIETLVPALAVILVGGSGDVGVCELRGSAGPR